MSAVPVRVVRGACPHDCPDTCALEVHVEGGVAVRVAGAAAHPPTAGVLCTKVARYTERTYHPGRVKTPLRRVGPKGAGQFEPVSWDDALADIGKRLGELAAADPESILPYSYAGTMGLVQGEGMAQRFFHKLGASRLDRTICSEAGAVGHDLTLGPRVGVDLEDVPDARLILLWGANPITSSVHFWAQAQEAKRRGAKLVAIDPYRSLSAEKCHEHIALLPGTDGALALGLMHVLIREGLIDTDYVGRHTLGYDELVEAVARWNPDRVAAECGIDAATVERLARDYGTIQPALIRLNYGMQRTAGGGMAARTIACLPALVGAFRHAAGGCFLSTSGNFDLDLPALQRPDLLGGRDPRTINMTTIGRDLQSARPPIRALVVYNSNPVAIAPDSASVARGFARTDLFTVVLEQFLTDTTDYADYVLPATTQLEHFDVVKPYGHYYLMANQPAIDPLGQARPNAQIFRDLARHMGLTDPCFAESDIDLARAALGAVDFDRLLSEGWLRVGPPPGCARFAAGGFRTPSGKVEFRSERARALGFDALPQYVPPREGVSSPLAADYPLGFLSPPARNFLNSSFVNVDSLRAAEGEPWLDIHPRDAEARGVSEGQKVRVFNARGSLVLRARITERARPGVVVALSLWWKKLAPDGKNANELTSQALTDLGRAPTFYDCRVEVEAA